MSHARRPAFFAAFFAAAALGGDVSVDDLNGGAALAPDDDLFASASPAGHHDARAPDGAGRQEVHAWAVTKVRSRRHRGYNVDGSWTENARSRCYVPHRRSAPWSRRQCGPIRRDSCP